MRALIQAYRTFFLVLAVAMKFGLHAGKKQFSVHKIMPCYIYTKRVIIYSVTYVYFYIAFCKNAPKI